MATRSQIRALASARPFRPYQVRMASGQTYLVRHPENAACALEGRSTELVVFDDEGMHLLDMMLVEALEPVPAQPAVPENN
jgi:hypothetical protein